MTVPVLLLLMYCALAVHALPLGDNRSGGVHGDPSVRPEKTGHYALKKRARLSHPQDTLKEDLDLKAWQQHPAVTKNASDSRNRPRCGVPDYPSKKGGLGFHRSAQAGGRFRHKRFVLFGGRLDKIDLTYKILRPPRQLRLAEVHKVFREALKVWSDVTPLTFTEVRSGPADINIDFVRSWHGDNLPFDGPGGILAHAFFPKTYREGDIHFDCEEDWTVGNNLGTDLLQVAAHEFGHVLGLQHSLAPGAIMSAFYNFSYPLKLSQDDVKGIQYLYGSKPVSREKQEWERELERDRERERKQEIEWEWEWERQWEKEREREQERERKREREREQKREWEREQERERVREREKEQKREWEREQERERVREQEREREREQKREREKEQEREREREQKREREREQERERVREQEREREREQERERVREQERQRERERETNEIISTVPDVCYTDFDAVSMIRGELFFFKSGYVWRIRDGRPQPGYPALASRHWKGIPDKVDAAFEDRKGNIWFFQGQSYWVFEAEKQISGPDLVQRLGLPVTDIQAALMWGEDKTQKVYFFKDGNYWRFNPQEHRVDSGHARNMLDWRGIPNDIDAAFQDRYGFAHFLRGRQYWKFDPVGVRALEGYPRFIGMDFFGCSPSIYR